MTGSKGSGAVLTCNGTTIWEIGAGPSVNQVNPDKNPEKDGIVCGPGTVYISMRWNEWYYPRKW